MRYLQIDTGSVSERHEAWWSRALRRIMPVGHELERLIPEASVWWLEIDEHGAPQREVGFDARMNPVVLAPVGDHIGFLIDASDDWSDVQEDSAEAAASFQKVWDSVWPKFEHLEKGG